MAEEDNGTKEGNPLEKNAVLAKFRLLYDVRDTDGMLILGDFVQGRPKRLVLLADKLRTEETGFLDCLSRTTSLALREGVPLEEFISYWSRPMQPQRDLISGGVVYGQELLAYCSQVMQRLELLPTQEKSVKASLDDRESLTTAIRLSEEGMPIAYLTLALSNQGNTLLGVHLETASENEFHKLLMRGISDAASFALRYGMPLEKLVEEWRGSEFGPAWFPPTSDITYAKSVIDYAAQYMERRFIK